LFDASKRSQGFLVNAQDFGGARGVIGMPSMGENPLETKAGRPAEKPRQAQDPVNPLGGDSRSGAAGPFPGAASSPRKYVTPRSRSRGRR
jgi:hypothetical protein